MFSRYLDEEKVDQKEMKRIREEIINDSSPLSLHSRDIEEEAKRIYNNRRK